MYYTVLTLHSYIRWFLLLFIILGFCFCLYNIIFYKKYNIYNKQITYMTTFFAHIQLSLGFGLYLFSDIVRQFYTNPFEMIKLSEIRFFAVEHPLTIFFAILLLSFFNNKIKKEKCNYKKNKILVISNAIVLILLCISIPWGFSSYVSR